MRLVVEVASAVTAWRQGGYGVLLDVLRQLLKGLPRATAAGRVAMLRLHGPIAGAGRTADWIELARSVRESTRFRAVVLDVDSPGGSATASEATFLALERLGAEKPLVASIRGTCASGGYLAAVAAHRIVATPMSIVGSIGVLNVAPRLPRMLDRLGIGVSEHSAGKLKGMGAPWREETGAEAEKQQAIVDAIYDEFIARVSDRRRLGPEQARALATGEVWLGRQALELGLVDEMGDLERAVEIAAEIAGMHLKATLVRGRGRLLGRLIDRFATRLTESVANEVESRFGDRFRM
jgi:protease-4